MKNIVILTATFIMLAKPFWPVIEYVVNYDYIVTTLCENKDRPELQCNGKCHLTKELAKEAGEDQKNPFSGKTTKSEIPQVMISESINVFVFRPLVYSHSNMMGGYWIEHIPTPFIAAILHPPRLG